MFHNLLCFGLFNGITDFAHLTIARHSLSYNTPSPLDRSWWIKITTKQPDCLYYFGSFATRTEAEDSCFDYVEDIAAEKAFGITVEIVYITQPEVLTVFKKD